MEWRSYYKHDDFIFAYNMNEKVLDIFSKYQEYLGYKKNPLVIEEDKRLEFQIIALLDEMGFSIVEVGTYLYTDVIMKIINMLNFFYKLYDLHQDSPDEKNVRSIISDFEYNFMDDINNLNSSFYLQLAKQNDMRLSLFHSYIMKCVPEVNKNHECLLFDASSTPKEEINYGDLAYNIANCIINGKTSDLSLDGIYIIEPNNQKKKVKLYL